MYGGILTFKISVFSLSLGVVKDCFKGDTYSELATDCFIVALMLTAVPILLGKSCVPYRLGVIIAQSELVPPGAP